jgi:hypothetical protein
LYECDRAATVPARITALQPHYKRKMYQLLQQKEQEDQALFNM